MSRLVEVFLQQESNSVDVSRICQLCIDESFSESVFLQQKGNCMDMSRIVDYATPVPPAERVSNHIQAEAGHQVPWGKVHLDRERPEMEMFKVYNYKNNLRVMVMHIFLTMADKRNVFVNCAKAQS